MELNKASGSNMVEYAIILLIVVGASITAVSLMGHSMSKNLDRFSAAAGNLKSVGSASAGEGSFNNQRIGAPSGYGQSSEGYGGVYAGSCGYQCGSRAGDTSLNPVEMSGNGTNVTSAEGTALTQAKAIQQVLVSQQALQMLADQTKNPILLGLAQQALMSAANQAAYVVVTNPTNPANAELQGLKEIATQNYTDQQLSAKPERILSSIEQWSRNMESGKSVVLASATLSKAEKVATINSLNEIIDSVNNAYGENRLDQAAATAPALKDTNFVKSAQTFTALQNEAKSILASGAADGNHALDSSLRNGVSFSDLGSRVSH